MSDMQFMRLAVRLARRGRGCTSPNPMVGAVLVKRRMVLGLGWHRKAGAPHAEVEAIRDAQQSGHSGKGATLYVTLEPCCTHGRTPPCTEAIRTAGIARVVIGATDPNPQHAGRAFNILRRAGIAVSSGILEEACSTLNEAFNHWIVHRTPFVTVKAAMTLDGKIATPTGESKWITGEQARAYAMRLRRVNDAILVGVNTVLADDPSLTPRRQEAEGQRRTKHLLRRIVLDSMARTPSTAKVVTDEDASLTTIVVSKLAPKTRVLALAKRVRVLTSPLCKAGICNPVTSRARGHSRVPPSTIDLRWLLRRLGGEGVTSLLVEGGGEVNASFLVGGLAQRVTFFYAPKILGGRDSLRAVGGVGIGRLSEVIQLDEIRWRKLGLDLLLTALVR